MVKVYRELFAETILLALVAGILVFFPLYFNMYTVSLHIFGPNWDSELSILGISMHPALKADDFVCVANVSASSVRANPVWGDILVFQRPNASVTQYPAVVVHRAINKTVRPNGMTYFETKGDNNRSPDQWVDYRGENYTWGGMFSELLLRGRVVGIRKSYAVEFPVAVMSIFLASVVAADIVISVFLMRRNVDSQTLIAEEKDREARPKI
jgi:signal peptidase I